MRIGWVVVGIVLLLIGAVLLFVPVVPQANETVSSSSSTPYYAANVTGFSLTGNIPVAVSWSTSGNASVSIIAGACTSSCQSLSQVSSLTFQNGTSGSFTLNQPDGGSIVMGVASSGSSNVTFKISTALTTVGTILAIVGILLLIVGIVLRKKSKGSASPAPATPSTESTTTPPPT